MAQLYFYYSAMNAGKTTSLLQSSYNYRERGMHTVIYTTVLGFDSYSSDDNQEYIKVESRIGLKSCAKMFMCDTDLFSDIVIEHSKKKVHCVLIDECQFLSRQQVIGLTDIVDKLNIPVLCYGLRTDFRAELFSGSLWLLAWADKLIELKTVCYCGRKATRVLRFDSRGQVTFLGKQVMIAQKDDYYLSVCRKHFKKNIPISL